MKPAPPCCGGQKARLGWLGGGQRCQFTCSDGGLRFVRLSFLDKCVSAVHSNACGSIQASMVQSCVAYGCTNRAIPASKITFHRCVLKARSAYAV